MNVNLIILKFLGKDIYLWIGKISILQQKVKKSFCTEKMPFISPHNWHNADSLSAISKGKKVHSKKADKINVNVNEPHCLPLPSCVAHDSTSESKQAS